MNLIADTKEIKALKDGQSYVVPESDYGKAEIWVKNNSYFFFEIPMYGGIPQYLGTFPKRDESINRMLEIIYNCT